VDATTHQTQPRETNASLIWPCPGRVGAEGVVGDEPAAPRRTNPGTSCLSTLTVAALCERVHVARRQPLSGELSVRHPRRHKKIDKQTAGAVRQKSGVDMTPAGGGGEEAVWITLAR
jgi:hypothetical protein